MIVLLDRECPPPDYTPSPDKSRSPPAVVEIPHGRASAEIPRPMEANGPPPPYRQTPYREPPVHEFPGDLPGDEPQDLSPWTFALLITCGVLGSPIIVPLLVGATVMELCGVPVGRFW
ncbi:hypothetical protein DFH06DRAFT_1297163 [Mycena polygramma]|nr:hypothetical protein DFH06DRAFT_1297163 [Mycena polygramma]